MISIFVIVVVVSFLSVAENLYTGALPGQSL